MRKCANWFDVIFSRSTQKTVEKVLSAIKENPRITAKELEKVTGLGRRGVEWNLDKLKKSGKIERIGGDNGGYWKVKKDAN